MTRFMSDAYGRGIVRSQVESTNLRANAKEHTATHAESFRTSQTEAFHGQEYLETIERLNDNRRDERRAVAVQVDGRNVRRRRVCLRNMATLYGQRPKFAVPRSAAEPADQYSPLWHLSPYEFVMYWEPRLLSYPQSVADCQNPRHHARLTAAGVKKIGAKPHWENRRAHSRRQL